MCFVMASGRVPKVNSPLKGEQNSSRQRIDSLTSGSTCGSELKCKKMVGIDDLSAYVHVISRTWNPCNRHATMWCLGLREGLFLLWLVVEWRRSTPTKR